MEKTRCLNLKYIKEKQRKHFSSPRKQYLGTRVTLVTLTPRNDGTSPEPHTTAWTPQRRLPVLVMGPAQHLVTLTFLTSDMVVSSVHVWPFS